MVVEDNEALLPGGYRFFNLEGCGMMGNKGEDFAVVNRSFFDIDKYFSQEISKTINKLLNERLDKKILVLDLAGGTESRAVRDIENRKEFGNRVRAINIDFAQNIKKGVGARRIQGNATNIPLADSSIDIVYSRQFLPFVERFGRKHSSQVKRVLSEVARVLKPGGIAFLDDEGELSGDKASKERQKLAVKFGVILESHDSALPVCGDRNFPKFWERGTRIEKFLVMRKPN